MNEILQPFANRTQEFCADDKGATSIEYSLIGAGISVVIAAIAFTIGDEVLALFASAAAIFTG